MEPRKKRKLDENPYSLCIVHANDVISDDLTYIKKDKRTPQTV